jgi:glycosyltransferase involved in cell wall biosynthesis
MINGKKVCVVMPAYNAEKTLERTFMDIPQDIVDEVLLVDDASHDKTADIARHLDIPCFLHERNLGYGRNQKTCYKEALKLGAEIVIMLHPDYQSMILPLVLASWVEKPGREGCHFINIWQIVFLRLSKTSCWAANCLNIIPASERFLARF